MRIKAALYNADHLEYGLVTIPFPIPQDQYNDTIKMLEALDIGDGFYGPGSGTFLLVSFSTFGGLDVREASGQTKVVNIAGAGAALVTFALAGQVDFAKFGIL